MARSRLILFIVGAALLALVFFLMTQHTELTPTGGFTWLSISIMYLALLSPFVFSKARLTFMSLGVIAYIATSLAVVVLLNMRVIPLLGIAIIIQGGLILSYALFVYLATSGILAEAERYRPAERLASVKKLQSLAESAALKVSDLPEEYGAVRKTLGKIAEDLRYLTPLKGKDGLELEKKIMDCLHFIGQYCDSAFVGGSLPAFEQEVKNLQALVRQRKLL
jgi:hypothetical protein